MSNPSGRKLLPAQLGFLAIYNPSLGRTDETVEDQIVYYSCGSQQKPKPRDRDSKEARDAAHEQMNLQLRQIGLAQGMVEFGASFADGRSVDTVETEKSRIILHELESGWWILASINFTVLPPTAKGSSSLDKGGEAEDYIEYSSREVKPALLLLGDLLQAHSTFLLHHASSMAALFVRTRRSKFMALLARYWDTYLSTWNVLMHGNPANSLYGGIKIAACGELGVGVGEEERGSGEREVLEGFVGRLEGLVDVVVSRFGDAPSDVEEDKGKRKTLSTPSAPWLGTGSEAAAEDGAIFIGSGALSRKSVRDVCHWMTDLYRWGPYAYGVLDNPSSNRKTKRSKKAAAGSSSDKSLTGRSRTTSEAESEGLASKQQGLAANAVTPAESTHTASISHSPRPDRAESMESSRGKKFVQYLKLGYGTHWTLGNPTEEGELLNAAINRAPSLTTPPSLFPLPATSSDPQAHPETSHFPEDDSKGHFLVGLLGDIESESESPMEVDLDAEETNDRMLLRTLTVELERDEDVRAESKVSIDLGNSEKQRSNSSQNAASERTTGSASSFDGQDPNKSKKLQVVVYVNRPFIFVFLFELRTSSLSMKSLYQSLHHQIGPLIRPLLSSTSFRASRQQISPGIADSTPIYDLVWDPKGLTINSTIPNIPDPIAVQFQPAESFPWSRIEALNTHMQILNTYIATTNNRDQLERTCKTSRGWWVVWTRIPDVADEASPPSRSGAVKIPALITETSNESNNAAEFPSPAATSTHHTSMYSGPAHPHLDAQFQRREDQAALPKDKEIFLIRRASDYVTTGRRIVSGAGFMGVGQDTEEGSGTLARGIGVDTKRYIEGLLSLSR